MKYVILMIQMLLVVLFVATKLKYDTDIEGLLDTAETLEQRLDSLSDTVMLLQQEVHNDSFTYPFKD